MQELLNKTALITGAANGIGLATAQLFCNEGCNLVLVDIDTKILDVATELEAMSLLADVSEEKSWKQIESYVKSHNIMIDIVVNNAGVNGKTIGLQDPENMTLKTWRTISKINLESIFLGCKFAIELMKHNTKNSAIVNVSSRSGIVGVPHLSAYASSKAAIRNYSKSVALYCAEKNYNIRCNTVSPAVIMSNMWKEMLDNSCAHKDFLNQIPLKRMGNPIDVANAILFLVSDRSAFITGSEIIVDGGILSGSAALPPLKINCYKEL